MIHQITYRIPILHTLKLAGGSANRKDVLKSISILLQDLFTDEDMEIDEAGNPMWENRCSWMRKTLVEEGYMRQDSERGMWEITAAGLSLLN